MVSKEFRKRGFGAPALSRGEGDVPSVSPGGEGPPACRYLDGSHSP